MESNIPVSIAEDVTATAVSILSIIVPVLVGVIAVVLIALILWWFWRRATRKTPGHIMPSPRR